MSNNIFVSIGIPVRNGAPYLAYTLSNILANKYPLEQCEIIVVDHGSTDESAAIVQSFALSFPAIKYVLLSFDQPNRPLARNRIIAEAQGDLLIFVDQDILVSDQFIQQHVDLHANYPDCIAAGYTFGKPGMKARDNLELGALNLLDMSGNLDILKQDPEFADSREKYGYIKGDPAVEIVSDYPAPFRIFWSCNVSVRKSDVIALGMFDENYTGWGLEDDDLAYRYQLMGRPMVFSHQAWAFHFPHVLDTLSCLDTWKQNRQYFFNKFCSRELELFCLFPRNMGPVLAEINIFLDCLLHNEDYTRLAIAVAPRLPAPDGHRLGLFVKDNAVAKMLRLTICFNPYLDKDRLPEDEGECRVYSLFGLRTPFPDYSIDQTLIFADLIIFMEDYLLELLLLEMGRVSNKIILIYQHVLRRGPYSFQYQRLALILGRIRFKNIEILYV